MTPIYKIALAPILWMQGRSVRRTALRLPEAAGPRSGATGALDSREPPFRILFMGDSSAAGVGVDHQDQALAPQAASFLAAKSGRPVEWQLVAQSGVNTREALQLILEHDLKPADLVVAAFGVNDVTSQRSPKQFVADYQALMGRVLGLVGARAAVISGLPPLHILPSVPQPLRWFLGQCARRLDAELKNWAAAGDHLAYVSLQWAAKPGELARDRFHPGLGQYRTWAEIVADTALRLLLPKGK